MKRVKILAILFCISLLCNCGVAKEEGYSAGDYESNYINDQKPLDIEKINYPGRAVSDGLLEEVGLSMLEWETNPADYLNEARIRNRSGKDGLTPEVPAYGVEISFSNKIVYIYPVTESDDWLYPTDIARQTINGRDVLTINVVCGRGTGYYEEYFALYDWETCQKLKMPDFAGDYSNIVYDENSNKIDMSCFSPDVLDTMCSYNPLENDEFPPEKVLDINLNEGKLIVELNYGPPIGAARLVYTVQSEEFILEKVTLKND